METKSKLIPRNKANTKNGGILKGQNGLKFGWKALDNINFKAIPDTTFTRDKTGIGDIEYFNSKYPGIKYPNGYYKEHPSPGEHVILYNPNNNDKQDVRLDALHIMPEDATYDVLNTLYRNAARTSDVSYNAKMRYNEDVEKFGKENTDSYEQYFNNEADGLLRNMFIEGTPEYIESKRYYPDIKQLREWNKPLLPYIDEIHKYLKTGKRPSYVLPEITVTPKFKTGGSIPKFQKPASPIKRLDVDGLRNDPEYKKNFNWKMHDANLALIQDSLIARNADYSERVAILGQVIPESGGYTEDHGNGAAGYVGWRGPRAINLPKDAPGQAHKLMSEIYDNPIAKDWSHGGTGTGVQTGKEMMNLFLNTQNVQQAGKAFMKGYVRPEKSEWEKRLLFLNLLKKYMK